MRINYNPEQIRKIMVDTRTELLMLCSDLEHCEAILEEMNGSPRDIFMGLLQYRQALQCNIRRNREALQKVQLILDKDEEVNGWKGENRNVVNYCVEEEEREREPEEYEEYEDNFDE
jgi:hypothetical protein